MTVIIKKFSEETRNGIERREASARKKEKYAQLVKEGKTYSEIMDILKTKPATITKYALETNMIPSISNKEEFDRNMMYHCIREYRKSKEIKKAEKEKLDEIKRRKRKYHFDPELYI